jgi:hypothetical protein
VKKPIARLAEAAVFFSGKTRYYSGFTRNKSGFSRTFYENQRFQRVFFAPALA